MMPHHALMARDAGPGLGEDRPTRGPYHLGLITSELYIMGPKFGSSTWKRTSPRLVALKGCNG